MKTLIVNVNKYDYNFKNLYWLTGLKSDPAEERTRYKYIHVEKNVMTSIDGVQLRCCEVLNFVDGFYSVEKRTKTKLIFKKEEDLYHQCFPEFEVQIFGCLDDYENNVFDVDNTDDKNFTKVVRTMDDKYSYNPVLWVNLFEGVEFEKIYVHPTKMNPAIFVGDKIRAALMCISI